ncbi:hypothetical protein ZYGR_0H03140 [Zygosaccharomyces rouxii]|uniref:HTH CENPB-type domain-containing protein n=1 Tax=Zygosaccharomyces rouxii TaxID=4956 RepID=A0A1Q2ZVI5_ZYGRO|nr:hypothetical protein ZYGR_0H03140 [Zygosaccharomyces rouxii]
MLSIEHRYNICLMAERHPKWTQLDLARWAYEAFQLPKIPSQGTISRLLAKKDVYMNCKDSEKCANRIRKPNNLLVRRILQEWVSQSIWNGIPVTSPILQDTAQSVWYRIPAEHREGNGCFSYKWITNFLAKMSVNISSMEEQTPKPPKVWTFEERNELKEYVSQVPPRDIFTLDETFLAYNLPLDYAQYEASQMQRKIEVATVMLCCNLDGSEKLKPLVVGKYNSYRSFRNYFPEEPQDPVSQSLLGGKMARRFGISYHSNRKSWLTSNLFHDWLARWDKRLVADNRKIWIVLDDSCSHRIINLHLKNIELVYTSANSRFLPFNWGVLDEFKTRYRIQQYQALISLQKQLEKKYHRKVLISFEQSQLTMSNAFKFVREAWKSIPLETIRGNWKSAGILPAEMIQTDESVSMAFKKNEVLEARLNELCNKFYCSKKWDHDMLLDLNLENKNTNFLSTEELVESAIVDPIEPDSQDDKLNRNNNNALPYSYNLDIITDGNVGINVGDIADNSESDEEDADKTYTRNDVQTAEKAIEYAINAGETSLIGSTNDNGEMDTGYEVNIDKFLGEDFTSKDSQQGKMYNVSTLIDKPNLFMSENGELDLRNVGIDTSMVPSEYFNDVFSASIQDQPSGTSIPSTNQATTNMASQNIGPAYATATTTEATDTTNTSVPSATSQSQVSSATAIPPFEDPTLNHILNDPVVPDRPPATSPLNDFTIDTTSLQNLQSNINIAQALGNVLKHTESRELAFSESTINEMKFNYNTLLSKIHKTRKNLSISKVRRGQVQLERFLTNANNPSPSGSEASSTHNIQGQVNLQLPGNATFF